MRRLANSKAEARTGRVLLVALCQMIIIGCDSVTRFPEICEFRIANHSFIGKVRFQQLASTAGFKVLLETESGETNQTVFRYEPYRFDTADVDHDGRTEVIVGLIKPTRFDPTDKKRLFILRIDNNHLRPMWLGSKVCQELVDFKTMKDGTIRTLERTSVGTYAIGHYYWQSFGLTLEKYLHHETSFDNANAIFLQ